jgi:Spy/CpxP family protein refolding chaperone
MSIKNIRRSVLVLAGAAILAIGGLFAGRLAAGAIPGGGSAGRFGPPRFGRIARALDLTDDQKTQIKGILKSHATDIEAQLKAGMDAHRALHESIMAEPIDETMIRTRAAELSKVEGDGAVLFAHVRAEVFPLLTDGQKQKIEKFRAHMRERGDHAGKGLQDFLSDQEP